MPGKTPIPNYLILSISLVQGIVLYALFESVDAGLWPSQSPMFSYPFWTLVIAVPVFLLLSLERGNEKRVAVLTAGFAVLLAALAVYIGSQAEPFGAFPLYGLSAMFAGSIIIACFKALMYLQQRAAHAPMRYEILFTNSWRNFLVPSLAGAFVLAFWLVLMLWATLFELIDIDIFKEYFTKKWFVFIALSLAFGVGVIVFRGLTNVIDSITRLLQGLIKLLLPLIVIVAVLFLATLVFTGLDTLWNTGSGTLLLLCFLAVMLFFTNAVYQDGRGEPPYSPMMHKLIYIGLCTLPVFSLIALYGLTLRLQQYGWTVERCWAFLIWLVFTLFSVGYVWGIIRHRAQWPLTLARVNTSMGLVVLALMLLANSPLLDFRKIALASQQARLDAGKLALKDMDYYYIYTHLARPGYLFMEKAKQLAGDTDAEFLNKLDNPYKFHTGAPNQALAVFWKKMTYRPAPFDVPPGLRKKIESAYRWPEDYILIRVDLNNDQQDEYVLARLAGYSAYTAELYYQKDGQWQYSYMNSTARGKLLNTTIETLKHGDIQVKPPEFNDLHIGDLVFKQGSS